MIKNQDYKISNWVFLEKNEEKLLKIEDIILLKTERCNVILVLFWLYNYKKYFKYYKKIHVYI